MFTRRVLHQTRITRTTKTYSSINLCFFGCRMMVVGVVVVVDEDDDGAIDVDVNVKDVCCVDGCKGRRVRFLIESFVG